VPSDYHLATMLAFLSNLGLTEIMVILVLAVLIFGKDLPQAASKAYMHMRKLRGAVDDLRRESGIDRELRNIERTVREAEWEARRTDARARKAPAALPGGRASELPSTETEQASPQPPSAPPPPRWVGHMCGPARESRRHRRNPAGHRRRRGCAPSRRPYRYRRRGGCAKRRRP